MVNKKIFLFLLSMFLISFASAWTQSDYISDPVPYGSYEITESSWYDPLAIWTETPILNVSLTENGCDEEDRFCQSMLPITLHESRPLVDGRRFFRLDDGSNELSDIRWSKLEYYGNIDDYETQCQDGETIYDEVNGTSYTEKICEQVKVGSHEGWIEFKEEDIFEAGDYLVKFSGEIKPGRQYDWQLNFNGVWTSAWEIWGTIGVGGATAEVTLNSPANNSIQYTNSVTTNSSANVTGGAYLVNVTHNERINGGSWVEKNSTQINYWINQTEAHGITPTGTESSTTADGLKFISIYNQTLTSVRKESISTATRALLLNSSKTTIATASFSGDIAIFNYNLVEGNSYYVVADNSGGSYTRSIKFGGTTYPISGNSINWTGGIRGAVDNIQVDNIKSINTSAIQTSLTQTFTNTYSSGDVVDWYDTYCDSDGDCGFAPANYTFSIDNVAPTVALNYPNSLIDYGRINGTLQLNLTATDSNLDKVWYNYNGTNVTITGAVSGVANLSNITLSTKKNVTIYANDTAGNLNATTFTWDYKIFENSRTHNTSTYETAYETISTNLTANSSLTAVNLLYNGTSYAMTQSGNVWSYSRDLPSSVVGNNSINFSLTYAGSTIYPNYLSYQYVNNTVFTLCNSTYNNDFLNISFQDESTLNAINASIPLAEFDYYLGTGTQTKTYQYINTSDNTNYTFCASPTDRTLHVDPYVQYKQGTDYPQRIWNPDVTDYTSTVTNQVLYLLNSINGIYVTFQVINSVEQALSDVLITAVREISGSDVTVGTGSTDAAGLVTLWLNPDFSHDFSFSKTGFTTYTTSFLPTQSSYTIQMTGTSSQVISNFRGIDYNIYPENNSLVNGTTYSFQFNLSSSYWDVSEYGFSLRLPNGTIVTTESTNTLEELLSYDYNVGDLNYITMDYYWIINDTYTNKSQRWVIYNTANTQHSVLNFFTRLHSYMEQEPFGLDDFARYLITFLIILISVGTISYKYGITSPLAVVFMIFLIIFFLDVIVGFIPDITLANGYQIKNILTILTGIATIIFLLRETTR